MLGLFLKALPLTPIGMAASSIVVDLFQGCTCFSRGRTYFGASAREWLVTVAVVTVAATVHLRVISPPPDDRAPTRRSETTEPCTNQYQYQYQKQIERG